MGCSPWGHKESDTTKQLQFHALEKEMATYSSVLAWRIPWSIVHGVARVGCDLTTKPPAESQI